MDDHETRRVLVTGATGLIGGAAVRALASSAAFEVVASTRGPCATLPQGVRQVDVGSLSASTDWSSALAGVDCILHAAARVHVMNEATSDPLAEFRRVNVEGTLRLAEQAVEARVRRMVFVSSIKVLGESTSGREPYDADEAPAPVDPYGISKFEAERGLWRLAAQTGLEVVVVRPVLVYGPGVKGNFASLLRWVKLGLPLPFRSVCNKRSLVALDNLVALLLTCLDHPNAANEAFLVSDGCDVSTADLLRRVGRALGKRPLLLPFPPRALVWLANLVHKHDQAQRLIGSLQVDISKTRAQLDWAPHVSIDEGLLKTVGAASAT